MAILGKRQSDGTRPLNPDIDLGENGYIFFLEQNGLMIGHPNLEATQLWDEEDSNGLKYIQEIIKTAQNGGGFVYYDFPLPNDENRHEPKVTYSKLDPHWGWVISASTYMTDYNAPAKSIAISNLMQSVKPLLELFFTIIVKKPSILL